MRNISNNKRVPTLRWCFLSKALKMEEKQSPIGCLVQLGSPCGLNIIPHFCHNMDPLSLYLTWGKGTTLNIVFSVTNSICLARYGLPTHGESPTLHVDLILLSILVKIFGHYRSTVWRLLSLTK